MHHIFFDKTNIFGSFATAASATVGVTQVDHLQQTILFVISALVGFLTIVHLGLQIRQHVKAILKEKRKK